MQTTAFMCGFKSYVLRTLSAIHLQKYCNYILKVNSFSYAFFEKWTN